MLRESLAAASRFGERLPRRNLFIAVSWAERTFPKLIHYNKVAKGGHFAAWESPTHAVLRRAERRSLASCGVRSPDLITRF